jgi:hypothetical protein
MLMLSDMLVFDRRLGRTDAVTQLQLPLHFFIASRHVGASPRAVWGVDVLSFLSCMHVRS